MKNACANSLAAFLSWREHGSLVRGAISGLQVIDCYPCPMVGIGKSKPGFVNGFWVWGPNWKIGSRWNSFWDSRNSFLSYLHLRRVELVGPRRNRAPRLPRQTRTDREKVQETESWLLGKSLTWVSSEVSKMPCGKARLTTSPNSTAKAISHMVGERIQQLVSIACGSIRSVVWRLWHKVHWAQSMPCLCCLIHPFLGWNSIQLVWRDSIPNWILDCFKFHVSTVSVWWTTGEGGASPTSGFVLNWHVG